MAKKDETIEATATEVPTNGAPEAEQAPQLGVGDLQNAAQVIDAAVSRGAFRANEAAQVGAVYEKLTSFIKSVSEAQKTDAPASE